MQLRDASVILQQTASGKDSPVCVFKVGLLHHFSLAVVAVAVAFMRRLSLTCGVSVWGMLRDVSEADFRCYPIWVMCCRASFQPKQVFKSAENETSLLKGEKEKQRKL